MQENNFLYDFGHLLFCFSGSVLLAFGSTRFPFPTYNNVFFQRFKCFGEMDAPDWVLAEIAVLSKIVSNSFSLGFLAFTLLNKA